MFNGVSLVLFFWDCPRLDFSDNFSTPVVQFLNTHHPRASFTVRALSGPVVEMVKSQIGSLFRPWLFGRLILQHFLLTSYIFYIDADLWFVKPWLAPLVRCLPAPGQAHKLYFAGRDQGLMTPQYISIIKGLGVPPGWCVNDGFAVLRNVPKAWRRMDTAAQLLRKRPAIRCLSKPPSTLHFG